jgi:heme o synthase
VSAQLPQIPVTQPTSETDGVTVSDFIALTKPRLSFLVLVTMALGLYAAHAPFNWWQYLVALFSTWGLIGSANAFNCAWEAGSDKFMARTAQRPLPSGRMSVTQAVAFAAALFAISLPILWTVSNALTAILGVLAVLSYVLVYTPLKARSWTAVLVGAIPGALPPLMGVTASHNALDAQGWALFSILALWQIPHFLAIAIFRKEEYRAAQLTSLPLQHGDAATSWVLVFTALATVGSSLVPFFIQTASIGYLVTAIASGLYFLGHCVWGFTNQFAPPRARKTFFSSLVYLSALMVGLAIFRI